MLAKLRLDHSWSKILIISRTTLVRCDNPDNDISGTSQTRDIIKEDLYVPIHRQMRVSCPHYPPSLALASTDSSFHSSKIYLREDHKRFNIPMFYDHLAYIQSRCFIRHYPTPFGYNAKYYKIVFSSIGNSFGHKFAVYRKRLHRSRATSVPVLKQVNGAFEPTKTISLNCVCVYLTANTNWLQHLWYNCAKSHDDYLTENRREIHTIECLLTPISFSAMLYTRGCITNITVRWNVFLIALMVCRNCYQGFNDTVTGALDLDYYRNIFVSTYFLRTWNSGFSHWG